MKYIESTVKFLAKHYILAVPLFVLAALSNLLQGAATVSLFSGFGDLGLLFSNSSFFKNPAIIIKTLASFIPLILGGGFLAFILGLVVQPATYGMVNKVFDTGRADLNDFVPSLQQNFVRYLLYWVGTIVVGAVFSVASLIILIILGFIFSYLGILGLLLLVLVFIAIAIIGLIVSILLCLWFSAMVIDGMDVVAAAKKSIELAKSSFWTLLGFTVLVWIAGGIASGILGAILGWIPFIGPVILGVIPAATGFIMIVFYLRIYREKTGRYVESY